MTRSEVIKIRISPKTKRAVEAAAGHASVTVSGLLRGLLGQAINGRAVDEGVRADMATVRGIANTLLDRAATYDVDPAVVHDLASRLHALAERHLGAAP